MEEIVFPNVRKMFIPDQGQVIYDGDLKGADAQVVAWEANDDSLKNAFKNDIDIHDLNSRDMFPHLVGPDDDPNKIKYPNSNISVRKLNKGGVHATNYGGSYKALMKNFGWSATEAKNFQKKWFDLHPNIQDWHKGVYHDLVTTHTVSNKYGYRCPFFDRIDDLLPKALAWIPQSVVGLTTAKGAVLLRKYFSIDVTMLLQVHDSLGFQVPISKEEKVIKQVKECFANELIVPYDDPLTIPWSFKHSTKSWGDCS